MRIVYVSYLHPAIAPGGDQEVAYALCGASARQGHQTYFIAAPEENQRRAYSKTKAPIVPMPGAERECFYFPQGYPAARPADPGRTRCLAARGHREVVADHQGRKYQAGVGGRNVVWMSEAISSVDRAVGRSAQLSHVRKPIAPDQPYRHCEPTWRADRQIPMALSWPRSQPANARITLSQLVAAIVPLMGTVRS